MITPLHRLAIALGLAAPIALAGAATAFAQQGVPHPQAARSLAATCANCHGVDGVSRGEIPSLAGRPAAQTLALLEAYRSGALNGTIMHQIAKGYTTDQLKSVADYYAALPAPTAQGSTRR